MELTHHSLDVHPIPKESSPLYINEPWLIDGSIFISESRDELDLKPDNVRIYAPLDINKDAILRRLNRIIMKYGAVTEENEFAFSSDVDMLISQIEIYDQIWYVRHLPGNRSKHSLEAAELVREFVFSLEEIRDGGAESFPFDLIDSLKQEFLCKEN